MIFTQEHFYSFHCHPDKSQMLATLCTSGSIIWGVLRMCRFSRISLCSIITLIILCTCAFVFTAVVRGASRKRSSPAPAVRLRPGSLTPLHGPPDNSLIPRLNTHTQGRFLSREHFTGQTHPFYLVFKNLSCSLH